MSLKDRIKNAQQSLKTWPRWMCHPGHQGSVFTEEGLVLLRQELDRSGSLNRDYTAALIDELIEERHKTDSFRIALNTMRNERNRYQKRAVRFRKALRWIAAACDVPGRCTGCGKPNGIRAIKTHAERAIRGLE